MPQKQQLHLYLTWAYSLVLKCWAMHQGSVWSIARHSRSSSLEVVATWVSAARNDPTQPIRSLVPCRSHKAKQWIFLFFPTHLVIITDETQFRSPSSLIIMLFLPVKSIFLYTDCSLLDRIIIGEKLMSNREFCLLGIITSGGTTR